jgi:hypothetical protein
MSEPRSINEYCRKLAARLPAGTIRGARVVREVRNHLEEQARSLSSGGTLTLADEQEAIRQFGSVDEIAASFAAQTPLEPENEPVVRKMLVLLVSASSLFAAALLFFTLLGGHDDASWWTLTKTALGVFVLAEGGLASALLWSDRLRGDMPRLLVFLAALALIAVGSATGVWSAHLGLVTGDWDGYAGAGAVLLVLQGAATAWLARPNLPAKSTDSA